MSDPTGMPTSLLGTKYAESHSEGSESTQREAPIPEGSQAMISLQNVSERLREHMSDEHVDALEEAAYAHALQIVQQELNRLHHG